MDKYSSCVWQKGDESIPDIQEVTSIYYTIKHVVESPTFLLYRNYLIVVLLVHSSANRTKLRPIFSQSAFSSRIRT